MDKNEDYNFENLSGTSNLDEVSKVTPSSYFVVNFYVIICNLKAWCFPIDQAVPSNSSTNHKTPEAK